MAMTKARDIWNTDEWNEWADSIQNSVQFKRHKIKLKSVQICHVINETSRHHPYTYQKRCENDARKKRRFDEKSNQAAHTQIGSTDLSIGEARDIWN